MTSSKHGGARPNTGPKPGPAHLKRIPFTTRLPHWLAELVDAQPESRAELVKAALLKHLGVQDNEKK